MTDIYQEIWSIDQENNGIEPILSSQQGNPTKGFVKVNTEIDESNDPTLRVLTEVQIPDSKKTTYELCRKLFNNFALPEPDDETDTAEERAERHAFVEAIIDTAPMQLARDYIARRTGTPINRERWHNTLMDHWFRRFSASGDPALSGFEHVIVGEQEGGKVQGYHFWYKYFLDDGFARQVDDHAAVPSGLPDDRITFSGSRMGPGQDLFPESVTLKFKWNAPDYERGGVLRPLTKRIGGFFVGCSVEGLMALGTVRAHLGAEAPTRAVIEGAEYELKLYHSPNKMHIRTFYPMFKGAVDPVVNRPVPVPPSGPITPPVSPASDGDVRIVAMLVNPDGHDVGRETVTLVHAGPGSIHLNGWVLVDRNERRTALDGITIRPGFPFTIELDGRGVQLSNNGSVIRVVNPQGVVVHEAAYTRAQAKEHNRTLIFG